MYVCTNTHIWTVENFNNPNDTNVKPITSVCVHELLYALVVSTVKSRVNAQLYSATKRRNLFQLTSNNIDIRPSPPIRYFSRGKHASHVAEISRATFPPRSGCSLYWYFAIRRKATNCVQVMVYDSFSLEGLILLLKEVSILQGHSLFLDRQHFS